LEKQARLRTSSSTRPRTSAGRLRTRRRAPDNQRAGQDQSGHQFDAGRQGSLHRRAHQGARGRRELAGAARRASPASVTRRRRSVFEPKVGGSSARPHRGGFELVEVEAFREGEALAAAGEGDAVEEVKKVKAKARRPRAAPSRAVLARGEEGREDRRDSCRKKRPNASETPRRADPGAHAQALGAVTSGGARAVSRSAAR